MKKLTEKQKNNKLNQISLFNKIKTKTTKITNFQWTLIILFVIFCLILVLNFLTPLIADDFSYSLYNGNRINSWNDIFSKIRFQYMSINGRVPLHFFAIFSLYINKTIFNIINSFMFVFLIFLVYKHIIGKKKHQPLLLLLISLLLWFFIPVFGQTVLWVTGSCNYLWGMTIILAFLLPFRLSLESKPSNSKIMILLMLLFGILAGWTNENTAGAMIFISIFLLIIYKRKNKNIPLWMYSALLGSLIGFILMITAPGNAIRIENIGGSNETNIILMYIRRFIIYINISFRYILPLIIMSLFSISYLYKKNKEKLLICLPYFIGGILAVCAMVLSPIFPDRAMFGSVILIIICIGIGIFNSNKEEFMKITIPVLAFVMLICFTFTYLWALNDNYRTFREWNNRINIIENAKKEGIYELEVPVIFADSRYNALYQSFEITNNFNSWPNTAIAEYFGIKSIKSR